MIEHPQHSYLVLHLVHQCEKRIIVPAAIRRIRLCETSIIRPDMEEVETQYLIFWV